MPLFEGLILFRDKTTDSEWKIYYTYSSSFTELGAKINNKTTRETV